MEHGVDKTNLLSHNLVSPKSPVMKVTADEKEIPESPVVKTTIQDKVYIVLQIISLLAVATYSVIAFYKDFERARVLFIAECLVAAYYIFVFVKSRLPDNFSLNVLGRTDAFLSIPIVRKGAYGVTSLAMMIVVAFCIYENPRRLVSGLGLVLMIFGCWLFSWKREHINWHPVFCGFTMQFVFAYVILRTPWGFDAFNEIGDQMKCLLEYTLEGSGFVFRYLATGEQDLGLNPIFAFAALPSILFFSAIVSILYFLGVLQHVIGTLGAFLSYCLGTSVAESVSAAGNIFLGQIEAPLLTRPFLKTMTDSELHAVMTGGFATIAGGVMAIYVSMGISPTHLLASSVMGAPAALAISKLMCPETEESTTARGTKYEIEYEREVNVIEAAANGTAVAVQLALNICGMIISFLALINMFDNWVGYFGSLVDHPEFTFQKLCSYVFYPLASVIGVDPDDCMKVAHLISLKIITNEFLAYTKMQELVQANEISAHSTTLATYALCGFSNFAAIGITVGGLSQMAPTRRADISRLVFSSMIGGNIACFMTACIAGLLEKQ